MLRKCKKAWATPYGTVQKPATYPLRWLGIPQHHRDGQEPRVGRKTTPAKGDCQHGFWHRDEVMGWVWMQVISFQHLSVCSLPFS